MQKLFNIGCKLNQYEGFCLLQKYRERKDFVIVNTCCVTKEAEIKSLRKFRHALKAYPQCTVVATGCACRLYPQKFIGAHEVIDNVQRNNLIKGVLPVPSKARYFLKIEDGCDEQCTYCIVPRVRERVESKTINDVKQEIAWARSHGYQEIVLVGANIGLYGIDKGSSFQELLKALCDVPDLPRIRLSSLEPKFVTHNILACLQDLPVCRHFHIPVQSCDDQILLRMQRGYTASHLAQMITMITKLFDDVAIGGDIIVGFPGETEKEFLSTYQFIEEHPFSHIHVFPYSPRPFTQAYEWKDPVPKDTKKERLWRLKELVAAKNYAFWKKMLNKSFGTIIETRTCGLTDNYVRVSMKGDCRTGTLVNVVVTEVTHDATFGVIDEAA